MLGARTGRNFAPPGGRIGVTNAKLGIWLCLAYILLYSGFIIVNAFFPEALRGAQPGSINGAIWYGLGLIAAAVLTSFAYGLVANSDEAGDNSKEGNR